MLEWILDEMEVRKTVGYVLTSIGVVMAALVIYAMGHALRAAVAWSATTVMVGTTVAPAIEACRSCSPI